MKAQYYTASSLDGFIATPDHGLEWLFRCGEPEEDTFGPFIADVGAIAMGSHTYEWLLRNLPATEGEPAKWPHEQPTWVFTSRSLPVLPGADVRFVQGSVASVYADMEAAAGGKNLWVAGGGDLAGQFFDAGLLDELIVQVTAVTLGAGAPLLPRTIADPPLRLVSAKPLGGPFVELRYEVPKPAAEPAAEPATT